MQIVVAHYTEDLSWIRKVPDHWDVLIYSKGSVFGDLHFPRLPSGELIFLENEHRESGTFLHHIVENYNNLDDLTLFVQGHPLDHFCEEPNLFFDVVAKDNIFDIAEVIQSKYSHWKYLLKPQQGYAALGLVWHNRIGARQDMLRKIKNPGRLEWEKTLSLYYDKMWQIFFNCDWPGVSRTVWGAQFAATRESIRSLPLNLYKRLIDFHEENFQVPWVMEHNFPELYLQFQEKYKHHHLMI